MSGTVIVPSTDTARFALRDQPCGVSGDIDLAGRAPLRRLMSWLLAVVLLTGAVAAPASCWAQRRNRGRGLPGTLGKLKQDQLRELDLLLTDVVGYLEQKTPRPSQEPGNFFGKVLLKPPPEDELDAVPLVPGQFGYYVLGSLTTPQIRQLSNLARQQVTAAAAFRAKQKQVLSGFIGLLQQGRPDRARERELETMAAEAGVMEAVMGLQQATAFLQIAETMSDDQREYLMLLRRTPDTGSLKNPAVAKIYEQAERLDPGLRTMVLAMAERCCLYLTAGADQNVPTLKRHRMAEPDSEEADRKEGLLGMLNPSQQGGLANLLTSQSRLQKDAFTRRAQIAAMLDTLKLKKHVDERRLTAPGQALGKADAAKLSARLQGLHQFHESLSNAQRVFIKNNVLQ